MSCAAGIAYRKRKDDQKNTEDPKKKKRKYTKSGYPNDTTTWLYKDVSKKCPFKLKIQLLSLDITRCVNHELRGRWILKVNKYF